MTILRACRRLRKKTVLGSGNIEPLKEGKASEDEELRIDQPQTKEVIGGMGDQYKKLQEYLTANPNQVTDIESKSNNIGDAGAKSLVTNTSWTKLKILSLVKNKIGKECQVVLKNKWPNVSLSQNK